MNQQEMVELYIRLRERRSERKAAYEVEDSKDKEYQEKIEAKLLAFFNETGSESIRTDAGTAYKSIRTSATVADWGITLGFIRNQEMWDMLEKRVSKGAVEAYIAEHDDTPPGVNITRTTVVNVRRSV